MCGIAGIIGRAADPSILETMISLIGHRGPDEAGYVIDSGAALAAVRLSIFDLANGQQPMSAADERFWIVFNGEIYNHVELRAELEKQGQRFRTQCDTEVALKAWLTWGEKAPLRFDGGFAFVVYDRVERTAWLVRDRFGKRPLFHTEHRGAVVFGSEIKALVAVGDLELRWDTTSLESIFTTWTPHGTQTAFEGVHQVPAGSFLRVGPNGRNVHCYAPFPEPDERDVSVEDAAEAVRTALIDAVKLRLRADVEVGVLLSGGLDSTITTYLVRQELPDKLRSFSIRFGDAQFDESKQQNHVVERLELEHASVAVGASDIADNFVDALWHTEVPQFRTAFVPMFLLSRFIRSRGLKVVLSGEGADEVFFGYNIFKETRLRRDWPDLDRDERERRVAGLYPYLAHFSADQARSLAALFSRSTKKRDDALFSHTLRFSNGRFASRLLKEAGDTGLDSLRTLGGETLAARSPLRRAQWLEFHTLLQGYLLSSQGDRMMFAHGVEPRNPFLSPHVVNAGFGIPVGRHLPADGNEKNVLKAAFADVVPQSILTRPKQPYRAPNAAAFQKPGGDGLRPWVDDHLNAIEGISAVDGDKARRLIDNVRKKTPAQLSPREDNSFMLLLSLSVLQRQFVEKQGLERKRTRPPLIRAIDLSKGN